MNNFICTAAQSRARDAWAIHECGIPSLVLMEHAGQQLTSLFLDLCGSDPLVSIVCGPGSNGGDGLVMARLLQAEGVRTVCFSPEESGDAGVQRTVCENLGIPVLDDVDEFLPVLNEADWIVDALFGSGLSRPITGKYARLVKAINRSAAGVFSVDVPSGLDATSGQVLSVAVQADVTGCLDTMKLGLVSGAGLQCAGDVYVLDIGIPGSCPVVPDTCLLTEDVAAMCLPARSDFSHKGTFGKGLVIGGCCRMHGALYYSANACWHAGIGLLSVALPEVLMPAFRVKLDAAMLVGLPEENGCIAPSAVDIVKQALANMTVASVGNGMGKYTGGRDVVCAVLSGCPRVVLDADGIANIQESDLDLGRSVVLTPHVVEFCRLTGQSVESVMSDLVGQARQFSLDHPNVVLVLKSSCTAVAHQGMVWLLDAPNSALAKGGSGDVLCGIITGLAAQTADLAAAAVCGVYIHSAAARTKKDPAAFTPEDLIKNMDKVFRKLRAQPAVSI